MRRALLATTTMGCLALLLACGKKGPPLPPLIGSVPRVSDLAVAQVGSSLRARFTLPVREGVESVDYEPREVELWLRPVPRTSEGQEQKAPATPPRPPATPGQAPPAPAVPIKDFTSAATLLITLSGQDLFEILALPTPELVVPMPSDLDGAQEVGLVLKTDVKRSGTMSNIVDFTAVEAPPPPGSVAATAVEGGIEVTWTMEPSPEGAKWGVNVYRALEQDPFPAAPANPQPLPGPPFREPQVSEGTAYRYLLRTAVISSEGAVESDAAPEVDVTYHDVFPPAPPQGLRAVADIGTAVTLIWAPSDAADLGGYHVYRREPGGTWERVDGRPLASASFTDPTARGGVTYEYAVTAHDRAVPENESERSTSAQVTPGAP
jgi:hypothetical protein